jgi:cytochrome c-type biogenesis protein CcmH/NrfF
MAETNNVSPQNYPKLRGKTRIARYGCRFLPVVLLAFFCLGADSKQNAEKVREIEDNLIAPCCWSQPVSQHYSEVAEQIRQEVSAMVEAGKSRDEIYDYYVAKYGERILATPRARGFNALVYIMPLGALALGAWFVVILIRRLRAPALAGLPDSPPAPDDRYHARIEKEMRDLDE